MVLFDKITIDLETLIRPLIYIIIGFSIYEIFRKLLNNVEKRSKIKKKHHQKRVKTINTLIQNIIKYVIIILVLISILSNFGINVKSNIESLGIT